LLGPLVSLLSQTLANLLETRIDIGYEERANVDRDHLKIASWNVAGFQAILGKGFEKYVKDEDPDVLCVQETKCAPTSVKNPLIEGSQANIRMTFHRLSPILL
jgi:hypothetical protein